MTRTLIALPYSPWSERARWALLHHRLAFEERTYLPMLGEPWLRLKAGGLSRKASVPLLLDDGVVVNDSREIVRHADAHGEADALCPPRLERELDGISEETEPLFYAGRAYGIRQLLRHDDVARAMLPRSLRKLPGGVAISRMGSRFVAGKYGANFDDLVPRLRRGLEALRDRLGGRQYVFDAFSYADILFATALQLVSPVSGNYVRIASAVREHWRVPELESDFRELLEWRDEIYARHRPESVRSVSSGPNPVRA